MQKKGRRQTTDRKLGMPYVTGEMAAILQAVEQELEDETLTQSLHFGATALANVRRVMMSSGMVITDSQLALGDIDASLARKLGVSLRCFIDDPQVLMMAQQRHSTRAEIAMDYALSQQGMKLLLVGSAPMSLNRLLQHRQNGPLSDLIVVAAPTGFASVVQLKERLWDSDIPCIVARGKKGGTAVAISILHALMRASIKEQGL